MKKEHAVKCKTNDINMLSGGIALSRECDCDGYHTFDDLYDHRITLYIALCHSLTIKPYHMNDWRYRKDVWRTKVHSDGSTWDGWFILGINKKSGNQITYHLPLSRWDETGFAETLEKAPEYDGHTSDDVLLRLKTL